MASSRRSDDGKKGVIAALSLAVPALYAALLLSGVFRAEKGPGPVSLGALVLFITYLCWRLYALWSTKTDANAPSGAGNLIGIEVSLLSIITLAIIHGMLPELSPFWIATHSVLIVALASILKIYEVTLMPVIAVGLAVGAGKNWEPLWGVNLFELEVLALTVGVALSLERSKVKRLRHDFTRIKLEAERMTSPNPALENRGKGKLTELNEQLHEFLQEIKNSTQAHSAILAVRASSDTLYVREIVTDSLASINESAGLNLTGSAFLWIMRHKKPIRYPKIADPIAQLGYYSGRLAVKSFAGVPIMNDDRVEGVIAIDSPKEECFTEETLATLKVATLQASNLLRQIRQVDHVKKEAKYFKALQDFSEQAHSLKSIEDLSALVLHSIEERITPDFSAIVMVEPNGDFRIDEVGSAKWVEIKGKKFKGEDGVVGWALDSGRYLYYENGRSSSRRPIFSADIDFPEYRSILIYPFSRHEERLGALVVGHPQEHALDQAGIAFCDMLCRQMALGRLSPHTLEHMKSLGMTDELTGLKNRRMFFENGHLELKRLKRYSRVFSLAIIDIDHFREINDKYGDDAGDEVLKGLSALIVSLARETDFVARIGGEEFAIIMPNTLEDGAHLAADRLRKAVSGHRIAWHGMSLEYRVSAAVVTAENTFESFEALVETAESALLSAKNHGRNRVARASSLVQPVMDFSAGPTPEVEE